MIPRTEIHRLTLLLVTLFGAASILVHDGARNDRTTAVPLANGLTEDQATGL
jgi:phenylacetic acid degradation operon negative regulatory protein